MGALLHGVTLISFLIFVLAVAARFVRIERYPLHLRWELYPIPHEGKRAKHGGSRLEELDWWEKKHTPSLFTELRFMLSEMLLLKALFEHNRKLWYVSFPFHFGLYLMAGFIGLLGFGAALEALNVPVGAGEGGIGRLAAYATIAVGIAGLVLAIPGTLGLLYRRLTDDDLKPYTTLSHHFNLVFILAALVLTLAAFVSAGGDFSPFRAYVASFLLLDFAYLPQGAFVAAAIIAGSLLIAYIPLTHMSHFFVKWFTWHKIRWDDEPNVKGGRIDLMIQKTLQYPVSWSADHVNADGKKNWVDIATEELPKE